MLDVDQLGKKGALRPGCFSTCHKEVVSINVRAEGERLHLSYPCGSAIGDAETLPIPSPSSICLVDSAAAVFISFALDLVALIADGA